jgi:cyclase
VWPGRSLRNDECMVEQLPPPHTVEVADGVFAYLQPDGSWWLNNTGFIVGDDAVVAIDATSTERRTRSLLDAIRSVTTTPVRTLVNTHHHGDHTNGNCLFADATVIGHRLCRDGVLAQVIGGLEAVFGPVEWGDLTIRPPEVVFDERLTLYVGDVRIELHHLGTPAHTTNDVVAWLPDQRVLFTGDLVFNGGTPFMLMGSVEGFLEALLRLRGFGAATLVPGHGPVCDAAAIDEGDRYARFVLALAAEAVDAGLSPLDAARAADLGEFAALHDRERIVGNLHRAMAEHEGLRRGESIDIPAAFGDMLAFNGGKLRCLA